MSEVIQMRRVVLRTSTAFTDHQSIPCSLCERAGNEEKAEHLVPYEGAYIPVCDSCLEKVQQVGQSELPVFRVVEVSREPRHGIGGKSEVIQDV